MKNRMPYYLSDKDKFAVFFISIIIGAIFLGMLPYHKKWDDANAIVFVTFLFYFPCSMFAIMFAYDSINECSHPRLMKLTFVFALICSLIGITTGDFTFAAAALYSILLYPFLEWLDIPVRLPKNIASTLLFSMLEIILVYFISFLIESEDKSYVLEQFWELLENIWHWIFG